MYKKASRFSMYYRTATGTDPSKIKRPPSPSEATSPVGTRGYRIKTSSPDLKCLFCGCWLKASSVERHALNIHKQYCAAQKVPRKNKYKMIVVQNDPSSPHLKCLFCGCSLKPSNVARHALNTHNQYCIAQKLPKKNTYKMIVVQKVAKAAGKSG